MLKLSDCTRLDPKEEQRKKEAGEYDAEFEKCKTTFSGLPYDFLPKATFDDGPQERYDTYYDLMVTQGGFRFWLGNYKDTLFVQEANDEAYKFWRDETRKRIKDPEKQKILAPDEPPHPIGTKRMSLEQRFYEVVDQPHVSQTLVYQADEDGTIIRHQLTVVPLTIKSISLTLARMARQLCAWRKKAYVRKRKALSQSTSSYSLLASMAYPDH